MKYIANKTVTRHVHGLSKVTLEKNKLYTKEQVSLMPAWYVTDYMSEVK